MVVYVPGFGTMSSEVAIFRNDHSVDAVPSNRVLNDVCYWLLYWDSRMETAKKREEPTDAWTKNNARSLGCCGLLSPQKRGIMFLPALVCLSVCLFVCYHDN